MKFAPTKCFVMFVTLKNSHSQFRYSLCNAQLDSACHQKYLDVYITCTLSWQLQCNKTKKKAMKVLGILQRNLSSCDWLVKARSYLSLVHWIVEYSTVAFSPHTNKGMDCIESIKHLQHILLAVITAAIIAYIYWFELAFTAVKA